MSDFQLQAIRQVGTSVLRATFTQIPLQVDTGGANDATNRTNWSATGPSLPNIAEVVTVIGDAYSVDVVFAAPLGYGDWTVATNANIRSATGNSLVAPYAVAYTVVPVPTIAALNQGASNDTPEDVLRKHWHPQLKGKNWDAVIAALGGADTKVWNLATAIFEQLFKVTATGKYLDILASADGTVKPIAMGLDEELFRTLSIKAPHKVTLQSIQEVLEVFFGKDSMRGHVSSQAATTFALSSGQTLAIQIDGATTYEITFTALQFRDITQATPGEVAKVISERLRDLGSRAFAGVGVDSDTGNSVITIYSPTLGLRSSVAVVGGTAQPFLRFGTELAVYTGFTSASWVVSTTVDGYTQLVRTATDQTIDLLSVEEGDYVVCGTGLSPAVTGWYAVRSVDVRWVSTDYVQTLVLDGQWATGTVTQSATTGLTFYRPLVGRTPNDFTGVGVAQAGNNTLSVSLPAVSKNVHRTNATGGYSVVNDSVEVAKIWRKPNGDTTVTTKTAHGLVAGGQVNIDGFVPSQSAPYTSTGSYGQVPVAGASIGHLPIYPAVVTTPNGKTVLVGGKKLVAGVWTASADIFCFSTTATTASDATEANGGLALTVTQTSLLGDFKGKDCAASALIGPYAGKVFISGGRDDADAAQAETWIYDTGLNTLEPGPTLDNPLHSHSQVTLDDGRVAIFGGYNDVAQASVSNLIYIIDVTTRTVVSFVGGSSSGGAGTIEVAPTGRVISAGGIIYNDYTLAYEASDWSGATDPDGGGYTDARMCVARCYPGSIMLDDGRMLVVGGSTTPPTVFPADHTSQWTPTAECEVYDDTLRCWTRIAPMAYPKVRPWVVRMGNYVYVGDVPSPSHSHTVVEMLDTRTMRWSFAPWCYSIPNTETYNATSSYFTWAGALGDGSLMLGGATVSGTNTLQNPVYVLNNPPAYTGGGVNGTFQVASVVDSTTFTVHSSHSYVSSHGAGGGGGGKTATVGAGWSVSANVLSFSDSPLAWKVVSATRTGSNVTISVAAPYGRVGVFPFAVGDIITLNTTTSGTFPAGTFTLTAVNSASGQLTYVQAGAATTLSIAGTVTRTDAVPASTAVASVAGEGAHIFSPLTSPVYETVDVQLVTALVKGRQYRTITVSGVTGLPDAPGSFVLGFATDEQTTPIKYLETLVNGVNYDLLLDNYSPTQDWPVGTNVTAITSLSPQQPPPSGNLYATGSTAGRVAAEDYLRSSTAAGINLAIDVKYPGDRGLGGEGQAGTKNDRVIVWGSQDLDSVR